MMGKKTAWPVRLSITYVAWVLSVYTNVARSYRSRLAMGIRIPDWVALSHQAWRLSSCYIDTQKFAGVILL